MQIVETGLANYWKKIYWPQSGGKCPYSKLPNAGPKRLGILELQGAFLILVMGFVLASLILLVEVFLSSLSS